MKAKSFFTISLSLFASLVLAFEGGVFSSDEIESFDQWNTVHPDDSSFKSAGHFGNFVRAYFNDIAADTYNDTTAETIVFNEGAVLAKSSLATKSTPNSEASKVLFMKKMAPGYNPEIGDWAFGVAEFEDGRLVVKNEGKIGMCVGCHSAQAEWDHAQTVEKYRELNGLF